MGGVQQYNHIRKKYFQMFMPCFWMRECVDNISCLRGPVRTPGFHQQCEISDKQIVIGDSYFSSVVSATECTKKGDRHYIRIVKQAYGEFPKKILKESLKNALKMHL